MAEMLDVIAPFFNEAESATAFAGLLDRLEAAVAERFGMTVHKILVDDGSRDIRGGVVGLLADRAAQP